MAQQRGFHQVAKEDLAFFAFAKELTRERGEQFRLDGALAIGHHSAGMLSQSSAVLTCRNLAEAGTEHKCLYFIKLTSTNGDRNCM